MNEPGDFPDRLRKEFEIGPDEEDPPFAPDDWVPVITLWVRSGTKIPEKHMAELKGQMKQDPTFRAEIRRFLLVECKLKVTSPEIELLDSIPDE